MMRIMLFLGTNLAVIAVASFTLKLLGVDQYAMANGGLDLGALLIFCAVFGFAGSLISLFLSKTIAKFSAKVKIIERPQNQSEAWLAATVKRLSAKAGIGMPDVGIFPSQAPNAFATGWNRNNALVAVSDGLMRQFPEDEIEAILGHEIAHVANGDMVTLSLIQGVVNTFVLFVSRVIGYLIDKIVLKNERGTGLGYYATVFVAEIVLGILASMIVFWFSRYREFRADAGGADLTSNNAMMRALARLKSISYNEPLPEAMNAFGIKKSHASKFGALFSTHPPLDVRIARLQNR